MTREEKKAIDGNKYYPDNVNGYYAFLQGAEGSDKHPKNVWHDASEEPKEYPILCEDEKNRVWIDHNLKDYIESWDIYVEFCEIVRWAYISDLLPKEGKI